MQNEAGAKIVNGEVIVFDGENGEKVTIKARKNVKLFINGIECEKYKAYEVTSKDIIKCICEKTEGHREIDVNLSKDRMQAFISVNYIRETEYKIKDKEIFMNLAISSEIINQKKPEYFSISEAKKILNDNGIIYGIKVNELEEALKGTDTEILIAEGKHPVNDIPSEIKLFFTPTKMVFPDPDSNEKVDYKNLFRISNVNTGDKIAEIIPEIVGEDGLNVFGQVFKREYIRSMPINIKDGCEIQGNDIIALIDGKAHISNRTVSVNPVYSVECVNMESCNIKFCGDIEVYDSVEDNMFVSAGGSLDVSQNVNTASVVSGGEITILGNVLNSNILSGQIDMRNKEYSDVVREFKIIVTEMIQHINKISVSAIKFEKNLIIKALTERNFNNFQKMALKIITLNIKNKTKRSKLIDFIKENVLGLNISKLQSVNELKTLKNILENEIEYYDKNTIVPLDIRVAYCQQCEIKSTGNIIIGGQGEFTSKLTAMKDIIFTKSNAVARGGILSAGENISLGIVGSRACISTVLMVPPHGKITAAVAHKNTTFCFGKKKMILEETFENININYNSATESIEISKSSL